MRALNLTTSVYDLLGGPTPSAGQTEGLGSPAPFQTNYTVAIVNVTAGDLTYSIGPNADKSAPTVSAATIAAGCAANVVLSDQYIWASAVGLICLGN